MSEEMAREELMKLFKGLYDREIEPEQAMITFEGLVDRCDGCAETTT